MTCIVGMVENGKAYIGADSAAVSNSTVRALKQPKVFRRGPFVIGYTSSFRMGQLLQYFLDVPEQEDGVSDEEYMVTVFAEAVRECLKEHGYLKVENNREEIGTFLVGYRGGLYGVASDLQATQTLDGMTACGSGEEYALGALYTLKGLDAEERILVALTAASYFDSNVAPPFAVMST